MYTIGQKKHGAYVVHHKQMHFTVHVKRKCIYVVATNATVLFL